MERSDYSVRMMVNHFDDYVYASCQSHLQQHKSHSGRSNAAIKLSFYGKAALGNGSIEIGRVEVKCVAQYPHGGALYLGWPKI
jgi:hypothetical protein